MADSYRVTSQRQTSALDPGGIGFTDVMEVTFTTTPEPTSRVKPVTGKVNIPLSQYTAERVQMEIEAYVRNIEEVNGL